MAREMEKEMATRALEATGGDRTRVEGLGDHPPDAREVRNESGPWGM